MKWIPIEDQGSFPEEGRATLCLTKNGKLMAVRHDTKVDDWFCGKYNVTHFVYQDELIEHLGHNAPFNVMVADGVMYVQFDGTWVPFKEGMEINGHPVMGITFDSGRLSYF